jgi:hypothetical protein
MTIGIEAFRDPRELRLDRMLLQPLRGAARLTPVPEAPDEGTRDVRHRSRSAPSDEPAAG